MQKVRVPINSFQYGEVSDSLLMRTDTPIYAQSAQRLENLVVMGEGSVKKRYGLKHIYDYSITYDSNNPAQSHLFKFIFDDNEQYIISVEHQKVRCFQLETDGSITLVETITQDVDGNTLPFNQSYLQQYTYAQYGDVMFISHPLFAPRTLVRTGLTSFEVDTFAFDFRADEEVTYQPYTKFQASNIFLDPAATTGSSVDVRIYSTGVTADTDGIALDQNITANTTLTLVGGSASFTNAREISFTCPNNGTGTIFTITGTDNDGASITEDVTGPNNATVYASKFFKTISSIANTGALSNISVGFTEKEAVAYFDVTGNKTGDDYLDSTHLDVTLRYGEAEMDIVSVQSSDRATVIIVDELKRRLTILNPLRTTDGSDEVQVTMIGHGFAGGEAIIIEDAAPTGGINSGNINGARTVTEIIDENTFTYTAGGAANSTEDGGGYVVIVSHAPTLDWDEQSWSAKRGYPAAVTFHENRLCFGGTLAEPDAIWMSKIGEYFNFDVGEAADTDSINLIAATGDVNEIRYMVSNRDLQVFTASGELYVPTYLNQAITPTNAQIRKQTPYGTEFVQPVSIDGATIFAQKDGKVVREYIYTDAEDAYTASAVSTLASHLINDPKCLAVAHSAFGLPDSYAALTLGSGDMALFSSNRAERRASWTRVTTEGSFCSVVAVHDRLFANIWYNDQLHLCEFDGTLGIDNYITDQVISAGATLPTIQNGDFEGNSIVTIGPTSTSGKWYRNTTTGANWETYNKTNYGKMARIIKTTSDSLSGGQLLFYWADFQFKKDVTYTIQFTLLNNANATGSSGTTADVRMEIGSDGSVYTGNYITESEYGVGGTGTFTETFTPDADGYHSVRFRANHTATSWAVGLDNVSVINADSDNFYLNDINSGFGSGDVVSIFEGSTYLGDETVDSDGRINKTSYEGKTVSIGKRFTSKLVTNPVDASMGSGPVTGEPRGITNVVVDVKSTDSMKVNGRPSISSSFTGKKEVKLLGYSRNPQVTIEQDDPEPMQINGIVAELIV